MEIKGEEIENKATIVHFYVSNGLKKIADAAGYGHDRLDFLVISPYLPKFD